MTFEHFGVICPPAQSHLENMLAMAGELQRRGHRVTFFNIADIQTRVLNEGFDFCLVGSTTYPTGSLDALLQQMWTVTGFKGVKFGLRVGLMEARMLLQEVPTALEARGISALLVDQMEATGSSLAERQNIPFVTFCSSVAMNRDPWVPPAATSWDYKRTLWARWRNQAAHRLMDYTLAPLLRSINDFRVTWNLRPLKNMESTLSPWLQISQQTEDFDFPFTTRPKQFHYIGFLEKPLARKMPFPWESLQDKPLIYASLGTIIGSPEVYQCIAKACENLPAQLVISLGLKAGGVPPELLRVPGSPLVVPYCPQLELLKRATVTISHGGNNTAMESLGNGVPLIVIPFSADQLAVGARLRRSGAGEMIPLRKLEPNYLRSVIERVLRTSSYRNRAVALRQSIRNAGGVVRAVDLILENIGNDVPGPSSATLAASGGIKN